MPNLFEYCRAEVSRTKSKIRKVECSSKQQFDYAATELRTREKSLELARQNYAVVNDRYENGMALVTDMVDAANVRLSAEIGYENARTMLLYCYYRLKYVTNTL